jgi:hypothetical protein
MAPLPVDVLPLQDMARIRFNPCIYANEQPSSSSRLELFSSELWRIVFSIPVLSTFEILLDRHCLGALGYCLAWSFVG